MILLLAKEDNIFVSQDSSLSTVLSMAGRAAAFLSNSFWRLDSHTASNACMNTAAQARCTPALVYSKS